MMMVVSLRALAGPPLSPWQGCEDIGYERSVTVDLPGPLQDRPVVDGASWPTADDQQRGAAAHAVVAASQPLTTSPGVRRAEIDTNIDTRLWALDRHPG